MSDSENKNPNGSTGPTSPVGKERSSQNSLKHGLCSEKLILPNEDAAEFEEIRDRWLNDSLFGEPLLINFAEQVAVAEWFHRRALREYNHVRLHLHELQPDFIYWTADEIKLLDRHQRYLTTRERAFNRAAANYERFHNDCRRLQEEGNKLREKIYDRVKSDPDLDSGLLEATQDFVLFPRRYLQKVIINHPLNPKRQNE